MTFSHFFNIIRPDDILPHRKTEKPFVVSTIFVDYSEYDKKARKGLRFSFQIFVPGLIEYLKVLARFLVNGEKIKSSYYLFNGQKRSIQKIAKMAAMLLPNSQSEYERLSFSYGIQKHIPDHTERHRQCAFSNPGNHEAQRDDHLILCVARIEGRKNQLNLIRALANTSYRLILIGARSTNQKNYYEQCRQAATTEYPIH